MDTPVKSIFFGPLNTFTFSVVRSDQNSFTCQYKKQKSLRVLHIALLMIVFQWHHSSEGVNGTTDLSVFSLKLRVLWGLKVLPMKMVVPDLQLQVEASPEGTCSLPWSNCSDYVRSVFSRLFQDFSIHVFVSSPKHLYTPLISDCMNGDFYGYNF